MQRELRIGNLVLDKDNNVISVIGITENSVFSKGKYEMIGSPIEWIRPIPLTEEWLLKFGFETSEKHWDTFSRSHYYLCKKDDLCFNLDENKKIFKMYTYEKVKYVHQLQNLFFALTNKEL